MKTRHFLVTLLALIVGVPLTSAQQSTFTITTSKRTTGKKYYEATADKGSVSVVVTDKKIASHSGAALTGFAPEVETWADYYMYGGETPGRKIAPTDYRYGFNGMEEDDELQGDGNSYTTDFRFYEPKVGRWLSTDPVMHSGLSAYNAFDGNPAYFSDPTGADSETDPPGGGKEKKTEDGGNIPAVDMAIVGAQDRHAGLNAHMAAMANMPAAAPEPTTGGGTPTTPPCGCVVLSNVYPSDAYAQDMQNLQRDITLHFQQEALDKWLDSPAEGSINPFVTNRSIIENTYQYYQQREVQVSATPVGWKPTMLFGRPIGSYSQEELERIAFTRSRDGAAFDFTSTVFLGAAEELVILKFAAPLLQGTKSIVRTAAHSPTNCFTGETPVQTGNGTINIADIKAGEEVLVMPESSPITAEVDTKRQRTPKQPAQDAPYDAAVLETSPAAKPEKLTSEQPGKL